MKPVRRRTVTYEPLSPEQVDEVFVEAERQKKNGERLLNLLRAAEHNQAIDQAVENVLRYRSGPQTKLDWALNLLARAYADETDPGSDPAAWREPL